MKLTFSPVRMDMTLVAEVRGDTLMLNGDAYDFAPLPPGAILPRAAIDSPWIAGDVTRDDAGVLTVPLILPHGPIAPEATRFPVPMQVSEDGPVDLPQWGSDAPVDAVAVIDNVPMNADEYAAWLAEQEGDR